MKGWFCIKRFIMRVKDFINGVIIGKRGNVIYYARNGKVYMRRYAIPGKKRKWGIGEMPPKQREMTVRFSAVQMFYKEYMKQVSPLVWRVIAKPRGMMAPNLFNSMNFHCFDGSGEITDFEGFHFTAGMLALPRDISVVPEGERFRVTWQEERDWSTAARTDVMQVGVLYDDLTRSPRLAVEVAGTRGDLAGEFALDSSIGQSAHVYIFFAGADNSEFSSCWYGRAEIPGKGV